MQNATTEAAPPPVDRQTKIIKAKPEPDDDEPVRIDISSTKRPIQKPASLRFSPTAWAKLVFLRDRGGTEIGGFALTPPENLLYVQEFLTVKQRTTPASISFDDDSVADLVEAQVDAGRKPEQFLRLWLHTHPGDCPQPSCIDENTFRRVFGRCDWAVMFILAQGGSSYCRLQFNTGPGGQMVIPVEVDYSRPFGSSDQTSWEAEYQANIQPGHWPWDQQFGLTSNRRGGRSQLAAMDPELLEELARMDPSEREAVLFDLGAGDDLMAAAGFQ